MTRHAQSEGHKRCRNSVKNTHALPAVSQAIISLKRGENPTAESQIIDSQCVMSALLLPKAGNEVLFILFLFPHFLLFFFYFLYPAGRQGFGHYLWWKCFSCSPEGLCSGPDAFFNLYCALHPGLRAVSDAYEFYCSCTLSSVEALEQYFEMQFYQRFTLCWTIHIQNGNSNGFLILQFSV